MPLNIIIAGAGMAGLTAAIALRRAGQTVTIFERSRMNNEVGAGLVVPPDAFRFLRRWGIDPRAEGWIPTTGYRVYDPFALELTNELSVRHVEDNFVFPSYHAHRVDLHNPLKRLATSEEGPGTPVVITLGEQVVGHNPEVPSITLASGETMHADVVIGADGLRSVAAKAILGRETTPKTARYYNTCYPILVPAELLEAGPATRFFNCEHGSLLRQFNDNAGARVMIAYACRGDSIHNSLQNIVGLVNANCDKYVVLKSFEGFYPGILAVLSKAPEIKRWPFLYRDPIPTWIKGKLIVIGDAAHPMLPQQGQGAAQGMEVGLTLGIVLAGVSSADPKEVEKRLALVEKIRRTRASVIQIHSTVRMDESHLVRDQVMKLLPEDQIPKNVLEVTNSNFGHDAVNIAVDAMREAYRESFSLLAGFFNDL